MKKLIIIAICLWSVAKAQVPGYTTTLTRMNYSNGIATGGLIIPAGATATKPSGSWVRSGFIFYDTTGVDTGLYVSHGTYWVKVGVGSFNTSLGSGYKIAVNGTNDVKSLTATNGLTADSATAGQVGIKLGGTGIQNTTTTWGAFTQTNSWSNIGTGTMYTLSGSGTAVGGGGTILRVGLSGTGPPAFRTYAAVIENSKTTASSLNTGLLVRATRGSSEGGRVALWADSGRVVIGTPNGVDPGTGSDFHFYRNGLDTSDSYYHGMTMENTTAATTGSRIQISPDFTWFGYRWNTDSSSSQPIYMTAHLRPEAGADSSAGMLKFEGYVGYGTDEVGKFGIGTKGTLHLGDALNAGTAGQVLTSNGPDEPVSWETGAGGSTPTLQQVLTAGSTLSGDNTITSSAGAFLVLKSQTTGGGLEVLSGTNAVFRQNDLTLFMPQLTHSGNTRDVMMVVDSVSGLINHRPIPSGGGLTVGTTSIASGTNTRILYNNSGVLGEYTLTGTGTVVAMQTSPTLITSAKVQYDGSNHLVITPASTGDIGFVATGSAPSFTFNKGLSITGTYGSLNDGGQLFWDASGIFYVDSRSGGSPRQIILQGAQMDFKSSGSNTMTLSGANVTIAGLAGTGSRNVVADASGVLSAPVSDRSVKTNIRSINYGLNTIMNLKPVSFEYREGWKNYGSGIRVGFIAQDIEKVLPNSVFTTELTGKMGYNETDLIPVLVKAVQELTARVEALENENKKLRRK